MMNANGWVKTYTDQFRPALHGVANVTAVFAQALLERLDIIIDAVETDTRERSNIVPMVFTGAGTKSLEVPIGESWELHLVAVSAAMTLTIRSGGILRYVDVFTTADTVGPGCEISAGPGAPIDVTASAAGEVTLHMNVTERMRPQSARGAGEKLPPGLPNNSVGTEIARHFPDAIRVPVSDPEH